MFRWAWGMKGSTQMQPCRPVVEGLEGRRLMSATLLDADPGVEAATHAGGGGGGAGKVSMQDFHFVAKTTAGNGAGKVSMQDFHFVMRNNSASPTLF